MRSFVIATFATLALAGCGAPSSPDFVSKAAMSDMYEVQAGKLAEIPHTAFWPGHWQHY